MAMRALGALLTLAVILHLAGGVAAAAVFLLFCLGLLLPAGVLVSRAPYVRDLPAGLRTTASAIVVVLLAGPWFFVRKAIGIPVLVDVASCAMLLHFTRGSLASVRSRLTMPLPAGTPVVPAILLTFSLVWMGYDVRAGDQVRFYGLFGVDFGNLVAVVSSLRTSPMLPLSYVEGGGPLNYHWLYFTLPAMLADFAVVGMSNAHALILTNLLVALLLFQTLLTVARSTWAAAIVLFAPFAVDVYQMIQARVVLGSFALHGRSHLLLSPLNSMIAFGNNSFGLVLALFGIAALARWNDKGKLGDVIACAVVFAAIIGYSITLVFPLVGALVIWTILGRVRRPVVAFLVCALAGGSVALLLRAVGILESSTSRHVVIAFDGGLFAIAVLLRMVPLWGLALLRGWQPLTFNHVLIGAGLVVPTLAYVGGTPTGHVDFSMKIGTLIAIAFAPLVALPSKRRALAALLVVIGAAQSAGYVLQFPYYRLVGHGPGQAIPANYRDALVWIRYHTTRDTIVIDPASVSEVTTLYPMVIAERRVWLPTRYTEPMVAAPPPDAQSRARAWQAKHLLTGSHVFVADGPCVAGWVAVQHFGTTSICTPDGTIGR